MNNLTLQTQQSQTNNLESYCVYMHTCTINNKGYIGETVVGMVKRFSEHIQDSKSTSNLHFHNALRKYGEGAFISTLLYVSFERDSKHLKEVEIQLIADYDTYKGKGYNMTPGGEGFGSGKDHPMYGIKHTPERNAAKSASLTGMKRTAAQNTANSLRMKGNQNRLDHTLYHFINKDGRTFSGLRCELQTKYGLHQGDLSKVVNGISKSIKGWSLHP